MKSSGTLWFGIILVAFGVIVLLDNMYVVDFREVFHTYWPLLLVIWGLRMVWRRSSGGRHDAAPPRGEVPGATTTVFPGTDAMTLASSTVFGDYTVAVQSKSFSGGSVSATFGDIDIDLFSAQLADGDHALKVDGVFGDTTIHLPREMAIAVYASTTFGDIRVNEQHKDGISSSLDYSSPGFESATKRLRITVSRIFGDVTVVS